MKRTAMAAGLSCALMMAGAAQAAPAAEPSAPSARQVHTPGDPLEPMNRSLFWVHKGLDHYLVRPIALGYVAITPRPVRRGVRNVIDNLGEPVTFINDVLQLHPSRAATTLARFGINSTVGVAGVFDVATKADIPVHYEDFGQTLGRWGVGPGFYVFIPVLGPSSVRDGVGRVVDWQFNPLTYPDLHVDKGVAWGVAALDAIDFRASVDDQLTATERTATDEYATVRSAYFQNRASEISDGHARVDELPDFDGPSAAPPSPPRAEQPSPEQPPASTEPPHA
jgi:phospholipid-binding lipoprotein MlaA